ncbi:MAG: hypothetical protein HY360_07665 [Verrucomicrobia bacterium]|nr:hypothetical protein [Verrucomicrobiota bacterium]
MKHPKIIAAFTAHQRPPLDAGPGANPPGVICLANEARFTETYFSEPLTGYAIGWRDLQNIQATLDFLFPAIQVGRRFEYKKADNAQAFYSESDDVRAIGADFKRVEFTGSSVNEKTLNKGLTIRVDLDDEIGDNYRELNTARLLQRILRNDLRRGVTAVSAAATNTAKTWDTTAGKDPDQDVRTDLLAGADVSGVRANRVLFGDTAWDKRGLAHRAQNSAGGFASAMLTPEATAGILGVDRVMVSRERFSSSASAKTQVVNNLVLEFYAEDALMKDDASHTKRFWTPCIGGETVRVYEQQISAKLVDITVEHYSNLVVTSTTGLRKLTIS